MIAPLFAIVVPRPWVWLIAMGVRRDWVIASEASPLLHQRVALISGPKGDREGWKCLEHWLEGYALTQTEADIKREAPHDSIVGLATVGGCLQRGDGYRVALVAARPLEPIPLAVGKGVDLVGLPAEARRALAERLKARAA